MEHCPKFLEDTLLGKDKYIITDIVGREGYQKISLGF